MNVRVEEVSSIAKKLHFEVAAEQVDQEIERAFRKIGKTAKIKGFRPGKVPLSVLEKYYVGEMEQEVLGRLINDTYFKALDDHAIPAVGEPRIVDSSGVSRGQAFTYQAEIEVKPEVTVKDYIGIALQKESFEADPADRRRSPRRVAYLAQSNSRSVPANRRSPATRWSSISRGLSTALPFEGGAGRGFCPGTRLGLPDPRFRRAGGRDAARRRAGSIAVTFPEDYGQKTLAGKPATFRVTSRRSRKRSFPLWMTNSPRGSALRPLAELRAQLEASYRKPGNRPHRQRPARAPGARPDRAQPLRGAGGDGRQAA